MSLQVLLDMHTSHVHNLRITRIHHSSNFFGALLLNALNI